MLKRAIFADYREQQAIDHSRTNDFAAATFDKLVSDVVTASRRYAGFNTIKSSQAEVQVAPGRLFDVDGAVYARDTTATQSMLTHLAAAAYRIVTVSVYGATNDVETVERDVLVDVDNRIVEPQAVATVRSRDAVLAFTAGSESADPQPPTIPSSQVAIAHILLDTTQVVSITMLDDNQVESIENLDLRANVLETWKASTEARISSLASDLAALANKMLGFGSRADLAGLMQDMARVKERVELPDDAADYGADRFLTEDESDVEDSASQGYDAMVEEGIRFPDANADEFEIKLFSANDPNAMVTDGLLLPAYDSIKKLATGAKNSDLGIAQYGFQTFDLVRLTMSRQRVRYGSIFTVCTNANWWKTGTYDAAKGTFKKDGETFEVLDYMVATETNAKAKFVRLRKVWTDTYEEPYWAYAPVDHSISGAMVGQSVLVANDMWLTRVGFMLTVKAANEAVHVTLCEVTNGVPDTKKVILQQTVAHGSLLVNQMTYVNVKPTFLKAGKRYALLLTSNANHKVAMTSGANYLDGTFFYSTDGAFFQGDLTKDLVLELWGAEFRAPQVAIEFEPINLDGGVRAIDILAGLIAPESTDLVYEIRPSGAGDWRPLRVEDTDALNSTPALFQFRARFVGTKDMMPGLEIVGSRVHVSRPKTAFKHVSTECTLNSASDEIYVKILVEEFDDTPHDVAIKLWDGSGVETADATSVVEIGDLPDVSNRYEITSKFELGAPISSFWIVIEGSTNSAANTFHVSERVHWAGA